MAVMLSSAQNKGQEMFLNTLITSSSPKTYPDSFNARAFLFIRLN